MIHATVPTYEDLLLLVAGLLVAGLLVQCTSLIYLPIGRGRQLPDLLYVSRYLDCLLWPSKIKEKCKFGVSLGQHFKAKVKIAYLLSSDILIPYYFQNSVHHVLNGGLVRQHFND